MPHVILINSTLHSFFLNKLVVCVCVCVYIFWTGEGKVGKKQYGERRQKRIQQHETGLRFVTPLERE
jgi:hypothetical protein